MKNNKPYSTLHYVLWVIAGSEISVLKNCPNDYNRHANIGLMIFFTSLIASLTAFIAGSTFVRDNYWAAGAFAVVWGFLIFSLDRSMVNSIKKDPTEPDKSLWGYFWPRLVLAVILSFFMSIPLDHIVFAEKIKFQMDHDNYSNWQARREQLTENYRIKEDSSDLAQFLLKAERLEAVLNKSCDQCPFEEYKLAKDEADRINREELPGLAKDYKSAYSVYQNHLSKLIRDQTPLGSPLISEKEVKGDKTLRDLRLAKNSAWSKFKVKDDRVWKLRKEAKAVCDKWKSAKREEKAVVDAKIAKTENQLVLNADSVKTQSQDYKNMVAEMQGFDTQFVTLFLMPNWGVQVLKWLIFLALLVIEILPTYLKLKTPIGQYDWEMYKREAITELETRAKIDGLKSELKDIEEYRVANEISLNKKLIDKVVSIEEKLANEMLVEWEIKAREQMKKNVEKAD